MAKENLTKLIAKEKTQTQGREKKTPSKTTRRKKNNLLIKPGEQRQRCRITTGNFLISIREILHYRGDKQNTSISNDENDKEKKS